jgi:hypothetical protein
MPVPVFLMGRADFIRANRGEWSDLVGKMTRPDACGPSLPARVGGMRRHAPSAGEA